MIGVQCEGGMLAGDCDKDRCPVEICPSDDAEISTQCGSRRCVSTSRRDADGRRLPLLEGQRDLVGEGLDQIGQRGTPGCLDVDLGRHSGNELQATELGHLLT